jgi:cytochrome oxidase assembly protein ShyY1
VAERSGPDDEPRAAVARRTDPRFAELAIPLPTAATYDVETEGKTGWRFVLTRRWIIYSLGALLYLAGCVAGTLWQVEVGQQVAVYNATVQSNFRAAPVGLSTLLPATSSYRSADQWRPVAATGVYQVDDQIFVRNRACGAGVGFEVLTPLRVTGGALFIVDRGCVSATLAAPNTPPVTAAPPSGTVSVVSRIVGTEAVAGTGQVVDGQIESIALGEIAAKLGGTVYTGAYGMLATQSPPPAHSLHAVVTSLPTVSTSPQLAFIAADALYLVVGVSILFFAFRQKFRTVNRFDPRVWEAELRRRRRAARKAFTDEETEDEAVDGSIPMSRWGLQGRILTQVEPVADPSISPLTLRSAQTDIWLDEDAARELSD